MDVIMKLIGLPSDDTAYVALAERLRTDFSVTFIFYRLLVPL